MTMHSENGVNHSSYIKVYSDATFRSQINTDGIFELNFDGVVDLALTPDAAEKVYAMLGEALPELRELAEAQLVG
ncbi:hypothetical protein ACQPZF_08635 [Actinosynnema sp. CS-041913]|uniref:hypothetical protein n=1 Tax=Actinosynnema sp. CS-041913 TaxID=3239917 RepID=UPI003D8A4296